MQKTHSLILFCIVGFALIFLPQAARAQTASPTDQQLAEKYAPVLYFHPSEVFRPQAIEILLNSSRLRRQRSLWFDAQVLAIVNAKDLFDYRDDSYFLDAWYGSEWVSDSKNYSSHRSYYQALLRPEVSGMPVVAYAHITRDDQSKHITIQYWFFYYYNDWFNKHEGDWEMVQVMLNELGQPEWTVYSQHHGGARRTWDSTQVESGTHPVVYIALGSHANYFWGDENYAHKQDVGNLDIEVIDRTGSFERTSPDIILIPDPDKVENDPSSFSWASWLLFGGHWGETAEQGDFGGPIGPAYKGEQWEQPYTWGIAQPLDTDIWYKDRVRVEVVGATTHGAHVQLKSIQGDTFTTVDDLGNLAILHDNPSPETFILAEIEFPKDLTSKVIATWPDSVASQVTRYEFTELPLTSAGKASLTFGNNQTPRLAPEGTSLLIEPTNLTTEPLPSHYQDWIWMASALSSGDLIKGVVFALLAAILPTLFLVGLLYWSDRYEKEPNSLLVAAFFWGALPAILISVAMRIFFQFPVGYLDPKVVQIIWAVLFSPLSEEVLKGIALIFIASRYRRELDNILDGIIYGAIVGIGFAMTGNIISYLGSFFTRGFLGLGNTILIEGLIYSLNQACYSAIFGAGLGYYRLSEHRFRGIMIASGSFVLALLVHAMHNLVVQNAVNLGPVLILFTLIGVVAIVLTMVWSLGRQRRCLKEELVHELPDEIYQSIIKSSNRIRTEWRILRDQGFAAWRIRRNFNQLCAEYAFKRMQARQFPQEGKIVLEAEHLREQILLAQEQLGLEQP